jgi:hypothetical protein
MINVVIMKLNFNTIKERPMRKVNLTLSSTAFLLSICNLSYARVNDSCKKLKDLEGKYMTIEIDKITGDETFFGFWDFKKYLEHGFWVSYDLIKTKTLNYPFDGFIDSAQVLDPAEISGISYCRLSDAHRPGVMCGE